MRHRVTSASSADRYGWTGREYDTETGLYFHRARYYAPTLRRFIQEDPVEGSTSPYVYVNGSPLEATDPSGMMMSWEMRMPDTRMQEFLAGNGLGGTIDGVSYDGNAGWLNGIVSAGGATYDDGMGAVDVSWNRQFAALVHRIQFQGRQGDDRACLANTECEGAWNLVDEGLADVTIVHDATLLAPAKSTYSAATNSWTTRYNPQYFQWASTRVRVKVSDVPTVFAHEFGHILYNDYTYAQTGTPATCKASEQFAVAVENFVRQTNPGYYGIRTTFGKC
ncbi:MAG TPA: RHS repeat-associated core domain-containing protein [Candidatus Tectomicrobia bacterium]|nr:RHS repeat-associated core domain-containing protein [Candidatus Tectomicrobia bacterium]